MIQPAGGPRTNPSQYVPLLKGAAPKLITEGSRAIFNIGGEVREISAFIPFDMSAIEKVYASKKEDIESLSRAMAAIRHGLPEHNNIGSLLALSNIYLARFEGIIRGHEKVGLGLRPFPVQLGEVKVSLPVIIDGKGFRVVRSGMYADIYALERWWGFEVLWPEHELTARLNFRMGLAERPVEDLLEISRGMTSRIQLKNSRTKRIAVVEDMVFPKYFVEAAANSSNILMLALGSRFNDDIEIKATGPSAKEDAFKVKEFFEQPANDYLLPSDR